MAGFLFILVFMKPFTYYVYMIKYNRVQHVIFLVREDEDPKAVIKKLMGKKLKTIDKVEWIIKDGE